MTQTFTKETVLKETLCVENGINSVKFTYTSPNEKTFVEFGNKAEWELNLLENTEAIDAYHKTRKFELFTLEAIECLLTVGYTPKFDGIKQKTMSNAENWKELENQMAYFQPSSHLFYSLDGSLIPVAYVQPYCGGVCNDRYDLSKVKEIMATLKEKGLILAYEEEKIPYYNASENCNTAIRFTWTLPKEEYNAVYNELKKTETYPSVRLKETWYIQSWFKDAELQCDELEC